VKIMKKKYLTRKKAIELCIELWEWCAKTGKRKEEWPGWEKWKETYGDALMSDCWFCQYDYQQRIRYRKSIDDDCKYCPLKGTGTFKCLRLAYGKWEDAITPRIRKKCAALFLKQIKSAVGVKNEKETN